MATDTPTAEPTAPLLADSDVIYVVIRRLERVADLMVRHDYGHELEQHLEKVAEVMEWLMGVIAAREEAGR